MEIKHVQLTSWNLKNRTINIGSIFPFREQQWHRGFRYDLLLKLSFSFFASVSFQAVFTFALPTNDGLPSTLTGVDSLSGICSRPVGINPVHICIQLLLALTQSLYIKQCAGQIKIMVITDTRLHILSAAKVRAESMKPVEDVWTRESSLSFIYFPSSPSSVDLSSFNILCLGLSNGLVEAVLMKWLRILLRQPGLNKPRTDKFPQCECKGH